MNKKGTDKILSIYWFVILTLVAGGIFAMVYIFYGAPYDVRGIESEILAERIADCISNRGVIDSEFFSEGAFNTEINKTFMNKCNFNFNVEEGYGDIGEPQYLYIVDFFNVEDLVKIEFANEIIKPTFHFYEGNLNFYVGGDINDKNYAGSSCLQKGDKEYTNLEKCTERRLYAIGENEEQYLIKILSVIIKSEKNVKQ